jgi:hypothetical protein
VTRFDRRGAGQLGDADPFAMWDAAYVLGSLDAEERRQYEAHLSSCARCREAVGELSGMPALLALLDPDQAAALDDASPELPQPPAELPDSLLAKVSWRDRRRRRLSGTTPAAAAVVAAAAAVVASAAVGDGHRAGGRAESTLVGRHRELSAVEGLLERAIDGHGAVVGVEGTAGIGKSRLVREMAVMAGQRGVEVFSTFCESHTSQVPFHAVVRLLRAATGVEGLDPQAARARIRAAAPDAEPEDLLLFDDLLGIADPGVALPRIDPDARRRRLSALVNAASLGGETPALYILEDVHWIDEVSESALAEFLAVIPRTPSLVLVTYRPEYRGALSQVTGAHTVALGPLSDPETAALIVELLGADPSLSGLAPLIAARAAGNPFFAEEIVRELAQRGVLRGNPGAYLSTADVAEVSVPATLQAAIAARIERLEPKAKRTLSAAAVIGSRFSLGLLQVLGIEPVVADLLAAQLIDQVSFTRQPEYVLHHPLIRAVAYESQLRSDRAELHRRVAAAIESGDPAAAEENAALIAEHLEAAGDQLAAYGWHMRAATWATNRDIGAARLSWQRARKIADALPADDPNRTAMRIAPRTMLCGTAFGVDIHVARARFEELEQLCAAAGDKASLAIAMAGLVMEHAYQARMQPASQLASEAMALIESLADPALTVGLSFAVIYAKLQSAEWSDVLRWSQRVIDLADGDPSKGDFIIGSPLAFALATRAIARYCLGRPGWRDDMQQALAMARSADPMSHAWVVAYIYFVGIPNGVLWPDNSAMHEIEDAFRIAQRSGDDFALTVTRMTLGLALVHRPTAPERDRGHKVLAEVSDVLLRGGRYLSDLPIVEVYAARERVRRGDRDDAIPLMRAAVDHLVGEGQLLGWGVCATGVLVETLLDRGADGDVAEAEAAIKRLAAAPTDDGLVVRDILLRRLRALLARAHGDDVAYANLRDRYRDTARTLGCEGHIAWAEAMP